MSGVVDMWQALRQKIANRLAAVRQWFIGASEKRTEASAFQQAASYEPGLSGVIARPPRPLPRVLLWTLLLLVGILIGWALVGRLDIVATAEGKLVPRTFLRIVQPAEGGVLRELLVREGDRVDKDQVLMRMDTKLSEADTRALKAELDLRALQLRRIDAELADQPLLRQRDDPAELFAKVLAQYRAYRQAYVDALEQERAALQRAQKEHRGAQQVRTKLAATLPFYEKQARTFERLGRDGFASSLLIEDKQRELTEKAQELETQNYAIESLAAAISQSERRIAQITSSYRQQLQAERMQTMSQLEKLRGDWDKQQHRNTMLALRAPQAGIVKEIATHTSGAVINPGTVLVTIVPCDEPLMAEVQIRNADAGFISPNTPAKVKISSYPFQKYGMVQGEVAHFSADATDALGGQNENVNQEGRLSVTANYKAHIRLQQQHLVRDAQTFHLLPGMQVVAEINLGSRTILEYLLSPVQKTVREAARER